MYQTFETFHLAMLLLFVIITVFVVKKKELLFKHHRAVLVILFLMGPLLEIRYTLSKVMAGEWYQLLPNGMCHTAVILTTILLFKYNRKLNILGILLSAGGLLTIIVTFDIDGKSLLEFRTYHFLLVHYFSIIANIYLAMKHNLVITFNDYKKAMGWMYVILTYNFILNLILNINTVFFTSGPDGTGWVAEIPFGVGRVFITYSVYTVLYIIPYGVIMIVNKKRGCNE